MIETDTFQNRLLTPPTTDEVLLNVAQGHRGEDLILTKISQDAISLGMSPEATRYMLELCRTEIEISRLAIRDPLTQLGNMVLFNLLGRTRSSELAAARIPFVIGLIDIDDFKFINKIYGENEGNKELHDLTDAFNSELGLSDIIVRMGSHADNMVLLFEGRINAVVGRLRRVHQRFENPHAHRDFIEQITGIKYPHTFSAGLVAYAGIDDIDRLIDMAEENKRLAKAIRMDYIEDYQSGIIQFPYMHGLTVFTDAKGRMGIDDGRKIDRSFPNDQKQNHLDKVRLIQRSSHTNFMRALLERSRDRLLTEAHTKPS